MCFTVEFITTLGQKGIPQVGGMCKVAVGEYYHIPPCTGGLPQSSTWSISDRPAGLEYIVHCTVKQSMELILRFCACEYCCDPRAPFSIRLEAYEIPLSPSPPATDGWTLHMGRVCWLRTEVQVCFLKPQTFLYFSISVNDGQCLHVRSQCKHLFKLLNAKTDKKSGWTGAYSNTDPTAQLLCRPAWLGQIWLKPRPIMWLTPAPPTTLNCFTLAT